MATYPLGNTETAKGPIPHLATAAVADLVVRLAPAELALGLCCHMDMMLFSERVSLTLNDSPWSSALPHVLCEDGRGVISGNR